MAEVEVAVVGAGVVGLAVAARLCASHPRLVLLERHGRSGTEQSSRNSEVIHAGIPYPEGSRKALLCVEGNHLLYERCVRHGIAHCRIGKLIVATTASEVEPLEALLALGRANGVELHRLDGAAVATLEPAITAEAAILSPNTGIVSAHGFMDHLLATVRSTQAIVRTSCELLGVERLGREYRLACRTPGGLESFTTEVLVNAAGLGSDRVAALCGIDVASAGYRLHPCKGSYFSLGGARALVSRLVYPLPDAHSLGIHAILGLDGRLRFGPDVEYLGDRPPDFGVDGSRRASFGAAVRRYLPSVADLDLVPDTAGIRAKLQGPSEPFRDFVIREESDRGLPGLVSLIGIESPGLTASLAIAEMVAAMI